MPAGLEFGLSVILGAFVVLSLVGLRRPGLGPMAFWMAGWIAAGASGVLILAAPDSPRLQFLTFPLGSLFPWLLLAGALEFAGRRASPSRSLSTCRGAGRSKKPAPSPRRRA